MQHLRTGSGVGTWAERPDIAGGDSDSITGIGAGMSQRVYLKEFQSAKDGAVDKTRREAPWRPARARSA